MLGGVAGGLADYLDIDPTLIRVIWAVLAIMTGGVLVVLYIVMWIVVPEEPQGAPRPPGESGGEDAADRVGQAWNQAWDRTARAGSAAGPMILGLLLIGVGAYFLAREYLPAIDFDRLWPIGLVVVGVLFLFLAARRRGE
jgi:phage shock protein PspC (stress-responsive transcriptional regulator)